MPPPGIGPITATALIAAVGNGAAFRMGRDFAVWVGLVPREYSTGGKQKLLGINKRTTSICASSSSKVRGPCCNSKQKQSAGLSAWLAQLTARTHYNVAGVALANKLASIAWTVLSKGEACRPPAVGKLQPALPAHDAWLMPGLNIASAIPTSVAQRRRR
jgi:transposase